jgi:hypothetical protein
MIGYLDSKGDLCFYLLGNPNTMKKKISISRKSELLLFTLGLAGSMQGADF